MYLHSKKGFRFHAQTVSLLFYLIISAIPQYVDWAKQRFRIKSESASMHQGLTVCYIGLIYIAIALFFNFFLNAFGMNTLENYKDVVKEFCCIFVIILFYRHYKELNLQHEIAIHYIDKRKFIIYEKVNLFIFFTNFFSKL